MTGVQTCALPISHAQFVAAIPAAERTDLLAAYGKRLFSDDARESLEAARGWSRYEGSCVHLLPDPEALQEFDSPAVALGVGRLEAHYFLNDGFLEPDQLVRNIGLLRRIPAIIVQGRYDVICPPATAWHLHQAWPQARLQIIEDAGHSAFEPGTEAALLVATNQFRDRQRF